MYPAKTPAGGLPQGFSTLINPETALIYPAGEAADVLDTALEKWLAGLSR